MKEIYTFRECCGVLNVDFKTFKKWLQNDEVEAHNSAYDTRIKYLTAEQVEGLAARHSRPWPPIQQEPEQITEAVAKRLMEQATIATRQAEQARAAQVALHAQLEEQAQGIAAQLAAIQREQTEQVDSTTKRFESLLGINKLIRTELERVDASQQEAKIRIDSLVTAVGRQQQEIAALQAQQQQARTDLDSLTTTTQDQQQRLKQLTARIEELQSETQRSHQATQEQLDQTQARMQEQLQQAEKTLQAQFQATLTTLRREMLERLEQRAQGIEQEQARDVADINKRQEQQSQWVEMALAKAENAATKAQAATTTTLGSQRRLDGIEEQLAELNNGLQAEQQARESQAERLTRQLADAITAAQISGQDQAQKPRQSRSRRTT